MAAKSGGKTCKMSPVHSADTLRVKNFVEIALSRYVFRDKPAFAFYTEIQDGHKKWRENYFWEKRLIHSSDTLWVKNFVEIALSRSVSKIKVFLNFTQKFKMAGKRFWERSLIDSAGTLWVKSFIEIALSPLHFQNKRIFAFYPEIQDGHQKWRENVVLQKVAKRLCRYPMGQKFR